VRYVLNLDEIGAFRKYAQLWIRLINRLGGKQHGSFLPSDAVKAKNHGRFSFPADRNFSAYPVRSARDRM